MLTRITTTLAALLAGTSAALANDLIVSAGTVIVYNTDVSGQLQVGRFIIETGGTLVALGSRPFSVTAATVSINGTLSAAGVDANDVTGLNVTYFPVPGALGFCGGGHGGIGSPLTDASSPKGNDGGESYNLTSSPFPRGGGVGGEAAYSASNDRKVRAGTGGGGGALAANQPVVNDPLDAANVGLIALPGRNGHPMGTGAISGSSPAQGGLPGLPIFSDADPNNDFWGAKLSGPALIIGEVGRPLPGRGGGAGGDASRTAIYPMNPFIDSGDERGAGGGGGGGLVAILSREITLGPNALITVNGGDGGGGENVIFFDRIGGGSGGGSGGWIVMESETFNFTAARDNAITALGGRGGDGRESMFPDAEGAGGSGGPGVIQLHTPSGLPLEISLPPGKTLEDIASPAPHVLLPILRR